MRIVALGGCGQEGRTSVKALLKDSAVSEIVIGDRDVERAESFARECNDARLKVAAIDVQDSAKLRALVTGADVVANFVGPYYRFGRPTLQTVIEAGVNYVDINDDTDATEACLALDGAAKAAGVTAVIGLGASPGLSNIMARRAYDRLDRTDSIDIRWQVSITDVDQSAGLSAALLHFLHAVDGQVPQFIDGKLQLVDAYSGEEEVNFRAIGKRMAFYTAHPEPWTLSRCLSGLTNVTCKGGVVGLDEVVPILQALGLTSDEDLDVFGTVVNPRLVALALLGKFPEPDPLPPPVSGLKVTALGELGGKRTVVEAEVMAPAQMTLVTGLPTAAGIKLLAEGEVASAGASPPETAFNAARFLDEVRQQGVEIFEDCRPAGDE